jgi:hypothetical protein
MEIIKWNGEKITKPGFYDMPIEAYHGDCCDGPSASSSGLRTIEMRSPAHFWATSALNPNRLPQEQKDAFDFGRAAHCLLLGEGEFATRFSIRPDQFPDYRTVAARAWRDEQRKSGKTPVTLDDLEKIKGMAAALSGNTLISGGLMTGEVETSCFWKDEVTGIWLKSRPDAVPAAGEMLVDLKTTDNAGPEAISRTITEYGYHMQGALALMGVKALTGSAPSAFVLVFVEKSVPFVVSIVQIDPEALLFGARQIRRALNEMRACLDAGHWPGPLRDEERIIGLSAWARSRLLFEDENNLLPKVHPSILFNENAA